LTKFGPGHTAVPVMSIEIRKATDPDVPAIVELIRGLAAYEKLSEQAQPNAQALHEHLFGPRPYAEVLVAEWSGTTAGFALYFHNYSTFLTKPGLYLEDLFVRPDLRGRGIGSALFQRVAELAVERGCGRLEWSVLDWNEPAIRFYRRMGAEALDDWTVFRLSGENLRAAAGESRGR